MDISEFQQRAEQLARAIHHANDVPINPPKHLLYRLAVLVDGDIEYLDHNLMPGNDGSSGSVVVFTAARVVHAVVRDAPSDENLIRNSHTASVEVLAWPRNSLSSMQLATHDEAEPGNLDRCWQAAYEVGWPQGARLDPSFL